MSSPPTASVPDGGRAPEPVDLLDSPAAGAAAVRGGVLRVVSYFAAMLLSVGSAALLFRHLGTIDTGRYSLAVYLIAIVAGVSDLGLTAVGVREFSVRTGTSRDALARNLLGFRLALSVAGVAVIVAFSLAAGYVTVVTLGVVVAGVGLVLQSAQSTLTIALISELKLGWVATFDFLRAALTAVAVVALILLSGTLLSFLAVTVPVGVVLLVVNVRVLRGRMAMRPAFELREWWGLVRDVLPYSVAVAAATLYFYLAVVLVSLLTGPKILGYFSVSVRVIQVLLVMPGLAVGAAFPIFSRAARDDRARLGYALGRVFEVSLVVGAFVALCLAIGAPLAIRILGGPGFAKAAPLLAIQSVGLGASFVGAVWANGLLSLHRYREILIISLIALMGGGGLIAGLVELDGVTGAAIATAADEFVLALMTGVALWQADRSLAPPLRNVPAVALGVGLGVATTLLDLPNVLSVVLGGAAYGAVVLALGAVPRELLEHVPGWPGRPRPGPLR